MNDNLISLTFKKPIISWSLILASALSSAVVLSLSATSIHYRILTLVVLCAYTLYLSYILLFNPITKCDLLTLIDTVIVWHANTRYSGKILSMRAVGSWLISISICYQDQPRTIIIFADSIKRKQYKQLMRLIRWKHTELNHN